MEAKDPPTASIPYAWPMAGGGGGNSGSSRGR